MNREFDAEFGRDLVPGFRPRFAADAHEQAEPALTGEIECGNELGTVLQPGMRQSRAGVVWW